MTPIEMLRAKLVGDTNVTDIAGQRIYSDVAPQGAEFPFVVLTTQDGHAIESLSKPVGFFQDVVILDIYSRDRIESLELWKNCSKSVAHYKTSDSQTVLESVSQLSGISWGVYSLDDASDEMVYQCSQTLSVNYSIIGF